MKKGTGRLALLLVLGLMVHNAGAADVEINSTVNATGDISTSANLNANNLIMSRQGGSSPVVKLTVADDSTGASSTQPHLDGYKAGGTLTVPTATTNGMRLFRLMGKGHDGTQWTLNNASTLIGFYASETWTPTATGAEIGFSTTQNETVNTTEKVRIKHDGKVGIGTSTPTQLLDVNGNINALGDIVSGASVSAEFFIGDGSFLMGLTAANLSAGTAGINISGNAATATTATTATTANAVATRGATASAVAFFTNVAVVAPSGGDYDNPATAMAAYTTWCGASPSAASPCLLKIMPGRYDIGTATVVMQPYIDIEGSGENVTVIQSYAISVVPSGAAVVIGADNAELRFVTAHNLGSSGFAYSIGIYNESGSPKILHVTTSATGPGSYGLYNNFGSPRIEGATITGFTAVYNQEGAPTLTNVTVEGLGGVSSSGGSPTIRQSVIKGTSNTIIVGGGTVRVANSQLDGGDVLLIDTGSVICAGVYDENFIFSGSICP
ncbi:MAG: hypothetical protein C0402_01200 [Thermodesulfovibrio sp.]|nr:hypothetical protein [Thermodesulfovibrio sp.]